jgi:alkanesulfonate monooxygenase SsuD/methylene tetrahydromethanopterin reductase-like flavin-dependent oxidoreductase (luciferase family)
MFLLRFDMRAPQPGASTADLYATALEMCTWSESHGGVGVLFCQHHSSPDGYLPSPLIMGTAAAARTTTLPIMLGAVLLPFYDPVKLAEDMNVLDIISKGRVSYTFGLGYRPEEYEHFGVDRSRRGRIAEEKLELLVRLRTGEPVEVDGRRVHVTPPPYTPGGPVIRWGGHSLAAARRAGRYGLALQPNGSVPGLREAYEEASRAHGHEPQPLHIPPKDTAAVVFVADDVDAAWDELGPYLFHDATTYSSWNEGDTTTSMISHAASIDELRERSPGYQIWSVAEAAEHVAAGRPLSLVPLCGGVPPEVAWPYLERAAKVAADARPKP